MAKAATKKSSKDSVGKLWNKAKEKAAEMGTGFVTVDPAVYLCCLTNAEVKESDEKKWLHVDFEFTIVQEGDFMGEPIHRRDGIMDEQQLSYLIADLKRLGVDADQLEINSTEDLESVLSELVEAKPCAKIRVKEAGEYTNVYINKLVEVDPDELAGLLEQTASTEDEAEEAEEAEEGVELEVGAKVQFEVAGETITGEVKEIDGETVKVKRDDTGKIRKMKVDALSIPAAEEEEAAEEEAEEEAEEVEEAEEAAEEEGDTAELVKGSKVAFPFKGKEVTGAVTKIDAKAGKLTVKLDKGGKSVVVKADAVELLEG